MPKATQGPHIVFGTSFKTGGPQATHDCCVGILTTAPISGRINTKPEHKAAAGIQPQTISLPPL